MRGVIKFFSDVSISPFKSSLVYNELGSTYEVVVPYDEFGMIAFDEICII